MSKKAKKLTAKQAELVQSHIALARQVAHRHRQWAQGDRLAMEDLESEAYMGLVSAATTWKPALGPFIPYAKKTIKNLLIQADRKHSFPFALPETGHRLLRDMRRAVNSGTPENPQAIASALGINVSKINTLWPFYSNTVARIVTEQENSEDWQGVLAPASDETPIEDQVATTLASESVQKAIATLPPLHRQIIRLRFGFETGEPMLSAEIMEQMGLGRAEYEAAEDAAMEKLEALLRGHKGIRTEN